MIVVVDSAIAGVFAGVVTKALIGSALAAAVMIGALVFAASIFLLERHHSRAWATAEQALPVRFPALAPDDTQERDRGDPNQPAPD
jgi:hypothetical protein